MDGPRPAVQEAPRIRESKWRVLYTADGRGASSTLHSCVAAVKHALQSIDELGTADIFVCRCLFICRLLALAFARQTSSISLLSLRIMQTRR